MKKLHKITALILILILTAALLGCSSTDLTVEEERLTIKVIVKMQEPTFWAVVHMGAIAAGKEFNVDIEYDGPTNEKDIDGQISMVRDAIDEGVDALVLAASDYQKLVPVAEEAKAAGMPVIIIDSNLNSEKMDSFIGTDNVDAGRKLGESLIDKVGENCKIAVMSFVKGTATAVQREEGFFDKIKDYPGVQVLAMLYCNSQAAIAQQLTREVVAANPDIDAIVCLNAYGTVGTAYAIAELNKTGEVKIIGFDSTPEEISFMEKDVIQSLVIQNPFNMGYLGVKYALDAINNIKIPKTVNTGSEVIDKDNMYLPENQKLVFPFID